MRYYLLGGLSEEKLSWIVPLAIRTAKEVSWELSQPWTHAAIHVQFWDTPRAKCQDAPEWRFLEWSILDSSEFHISGRPITALMKFLETE